VNSSCTHSNLTESITPRQRKNYARSPLVIDSHLYQSRRASPLIRDILASEKDVDIAVAAARKAFRETWGKNVSGFERSRLINKLADLIERDRQILAELECLNNGKPVKVARCVRARRINAVLIFLCFRDADIGDSVGCLRYYAGWADKILGQVSYPIGLLYVGRTDYRIRASKSTTRPRSQSPIRSQLVSAARCA